MDEKENPDRSTLKMNPLFDNLSEDFEKFMEPEMIRPWTINLLYGHKLFGIALSQIMGWGFVFGIILIYLIFPKQRRLHLFLTLMISFWLIFDLRLNYDIYKNYSTAKADLQKGKYFTIEDFYPFLDYINEKTAAAPKKIYYVGPDWPYRNILQYYLLPHKMAANIGEADYLIIYRSPFHVEENKRIVAGRDVICERCEWIGMFRAGANLFKKIEEK